MVCPGNEKTGDTGGAIRDGCATGHYGESDATANRFATSTHGSFPIGLISN